MATDGLSFAEIGARWPDALVLWDRDVAGQGWTPVFRESRAQLCAFDRECPHAVRGNEQKTIAWQACRCVTWNGRAWLTLSADRYEAVRRALRGDHVELETPGWKVLVNMLGDDSVTEITPTAFVVRKRFDAFSYDLAVAPSVISFLLDGDALPDTGHAIRRVLPSRLTLRDPTALLHARFDASATRTVIRIGDSEAELAELGPETPVVDPVRFVVLDRVCPHCGQVPPRYRVQRGGYLVCQACHRHIPPP